ncbi:MAG: chorismate lyase [Gammaproteobacteria bacterium]|nr:chorismate lyase [Gammaproteobacteria bacterium]
MNELKGLLAGWQPSNNTIKQAMPANLKDWLIEADAITPMLQKAFSDWHLALVSQKWQTLLADELEPLQTDNTKAWIREIFHEGLGKKHIYAKLSVPEQTFYRYQAQLEGLGGQPIGAALFFNNPDVIRSDFSYRLISKEDANYGAACQAVTNEPLLWARRSVFSWLGSPILLTEIFSPNLPKL